MGVFSTLVDNLEFPLQARAMGNRVEVVGLDGNQSSPRRGILAIVRQDDQEYRVGLSELELIDPDPVSAEWLVQRQRPDTPLLSVISHRRRNQSFLHRCFAVCSPYNFLLMICFSKILARNRQNFVAGCVMDQPKKSLGCDRLITLVLYRKNLFKLHNSEDVSEMRARIAEDYGCVLPR